MGKGYSIITPVGFIPSLSPSEATVIVTSGTANVFGSWVALGQLPPYPTRHIKLAGRPFSSSGGGPALINLGLGSATVAPSRILIPNIVANLVTNYIGVPLEFDIPLWMPPSSYLWAQIAQNSSVAYNFEIGALVESRILGSPFRTVTSYVVSATSSGTILTGTGTSGSYGPATVASSFGPHKAWGFLVTPVGSPNWQSWSVEVSFGGNILFPLSAVIVTDNSYVTTWPSWYGPYECDLGSSVTVTVSGNYGQSTAGNQIQIGLYGFD